MKNGKIEVLFDLNVSASVAWRRAKKVQGIKAKAMINLLVDATVANTFLLNTLEGREPLDMGAIFCIGQAGDAWQQSAKNLLKKYDVTDITSDGWMVCSPKPNAEVQAVEVTLDLLNGLNCPDASYIQGIYGETIESLENLQAFEVGDFVCRDPENHKDQWVVRKKLFNNTYTFLG